MYLYYGVTYRIILSILFLSYTSIHINTIPSSAHGHTFQLASPPNTLHLSSMSYPADYDGDDPPPPAFIYANHDSDDEDDCGGVGYNDSDDEAGCGGVGYDGDGVDTKIPAKKDAPINIMRNMASKFFNWECILPFNTAPRAEEKTLVNLMDYVNPNPKIISKEYQAECIQNWLPLDSLFQFHSLYHGEKMWKILLSEPEHEAAVQGGFRLVFLRKSENRDRTIVQYTIGCVRNKVYGGNKKKVPNAAKNFKGKDSCADKLHTDGIKKIAIKGGNYERRNLDGMKVPRGRYTILPVEKEERCPFRMTICFKKKDGLFYLSRHGSGCEHKGHYKKNEKTSAAHATKSELKTVLAMVQSPIKARGAASLLEKLSVKKYTAKQVGP
jgi:hypothetical protein